MPRSLFSVGVRYDILSRNDTWPSMLYLITIFPFHFFYILFRFPFVCIVNFLYGDAVVFTVLYTLIIGERSFSCPDLWAPLCDRMEGRWHCRDWRSSEGITRNGMRSEPHCWRENHMEGLAAWTTPRDKTGCLDPIEFRPQLYMHRTSKLFSVFSHWH